MFMVGCVGHGGSLVLIWKKKVEVGIQNYSIRHNKNTGMDFQTKFMSFYGNPEVAQKEKW